MNSFYKILFGFLLLNFFGCSNKKNTTENGAIDSTFSDTTKILLQDTALVDYGPVNETFVDEEETTRDEDPNDTDELGKLK